MASWTVETLDKVVDEELDGLPKDMQARFVRVVELIEEFGLPSMGLPHVRSLGNKFWEIRVNGRDGIARAIYVVAKGRRVVVIHVFIKKTEKTPTAALKMAEFRAQKAGLI